MNLNEAQSILLRYRPGTADAEDPQIAEALSLAKDTPELARWLETHGALQRAVGEKFRAITAPAGLMEQIISEQAANERRVPARQKLRLAVALVIILFATLAVFWLPHRPPDNALAVYKNDMARLALSPYTMDLATNDPAAIRTHLAEQDAPADFVLPAPLQQTTMSGCAVESWQGVKVSMICFRTGKPLAPGSASDLWLFVVDRAAVKNVPAGNTPRIARVNRLITATWVRGDKLYLLGIEDANTTIQPYL